VRRGSYNNDPAPLRVIVADDYPPLRSLLRELLGPRGIEIVAEAQDGREAVDAVDHTRCDVLIMDLNMPVMDGLEATRTVRRQHPELHVVAFTSSTDRETVDAFQAAGAHAHFSKLDYDGLIEHLVELRLASREGDLYGDE
jgi:NarL family two-component system response regulator LiaR